MRRYRRVREFARRGAAAFLIGVLAFGSIPLAGYAEAASELLSGGSQQGTSADEAAVEGVNAADAPEPSAEPVLDAAPAAINAPSSQTESPQREGEDAAPTVNEASGESEAEDAAEGDAADASSGEQAVSVGADDEDKAGEQVDTFADAANEDGTYTVGSAEELTTAVANISQSAEKDATIVLTASVELSNDSRFAGIAGKHVTVTSKDGAAYKLPIAHELEGDLTLDRMDPGLSQDPSGVLYANSHAFSTTENFAAVIHAVYGGGSQGNNVAGDTDVEIRGGAVKYLYGGGLDSAVGGNTHVVIDGENAVIDNVYGGGQAKATASGTVAGDATVDLRCGTAKHIFGGGENAYSEDDDRNPAKVSGTAHVNLGYAGAPANTVWPGTAMLTYGGSVHSTVGNVRLVLSDGVSLKNGEGDRDVFGCGYNDTVLGTVEVRVEGSPYIGNAFIYGGGANGGNSDPDGTDEFGLPVRILNQKDEQNALSIVYDVPGESWDDAPGRGISAGSDNSLSMEINGNVSVELKAGNLAFLVLDNENHGSCTIKGDAVAHVTNGRVGQFQGNKKHYTDSAASGVSKALLSSGKAEIGYFYYFEDVDVESGANVTVDSELFDQFSQINSPFYSVNGLSVTGDASLTTRNSSTKILGDVVMDNGTWHAKGYVYVDDSMKTQDSSIYWDTYYQVGNAHKEDADLTKRVAWQSKGDTFVANANDYLNQMYGNVDVANSTWALLSRTVVNGNFKADALTLQLPVVAAGTNYPASDIALCISDTASGKTTVYTVAASNVADSTLWKAALAMPTLGDNYIIGLAPEGTDKDNPIQATFVLGNEDATSQGYYLKRVVDPEASDANYMWQVARDPRSVLTYDKNADAATGETPATQGEIGDIVSVAENGFTRHGYTFTGWNTEPDGSGVFYTEGQDFTLPAGGDVLYAQWKPNDPWFPHAIELTAYEGGVGSDNSDGVADGLPEPEWVSAREDVPVYVDGAFWDTDEKGVPFSWGYFDEAGQPVATSAKAGAYTLRVWERDDLKGHEIAVDDRPLALPADGIVTTVDVRDVTDDEAAESVSANVLRPVYNAGSSLLSDTVPAFARAMPTSLAEDSALDGSFGETGARDEWCGLDESVHAHVKEGTTFLKNGREDLPVNEGARIGLLWDEPLSDVLGRDDIAVKMEDMAEDAVRGAFDDASDVQHEMKYADLVDMNDGNLWVGTKQNDVTVFWPYPEGVDASDEIAAVCYDGLTRDYTIDMEPGALEDAVDASAAHELALTKTDKGVLIDVPSKQFGPLDLMWQVDDGADPTPTPEPPAPRPEQESSSGAEQGDLPQTGDASLFVVGVAAASACALLAAGLFVRRRTRR